MAEPENTMTESPWRWSQDWWPSFEAPDPTRCTFLGQIGELDVWADNRDTPYTEKREARVHDYEFDVIRDDPLLDRTTFKVDVSGNLVPFTDLEEPIDPYTMCQIYALVHKFLEDNNVPK